jgi:hypothetical protein
VTYWDRDFRGFAVSEHGNGFKGAWNIPTVSMLCSAPAINSAPASNGTAEQQTMWPESCSSNGAALFAQPRTDSYYDGIAFLQGVRGFTALTGTFMSPDAFGGGYAYANNNALDYGDPSGFVFLPYPAGGGGGGVLAGAIPGFGPAAAAVSIVADIAELFGFFRPRKPPGPPGDHQPWDEHWPGLSTVIDDGTQVADIEPEDEELLFIYNLKYGIGPGPNAHESVPGRRGVMPSKAESAQVKKIGDKYGCHTCGTRDPGTKSGNWIRDHQPPNALNKLPDASIFPQCLSCSNTQGGGVSNIVRKLRGY